MVLRQYYKGIIWLCVVAALMVCCSNDFSDKEETEKAASKGKRILVDVKRRQHTISPMLHGAHLVYHLEADSIYADADWQSLVSSSNNYEPTPTAVLYKLYKHALGGELVYSISEDRRIMSAAVVQHNEKAFVYLLNKNDEAVEISIRLSGCDMLGVTQILSFKDPGVVEVMEATRNDEVYNTELPLYSLTMIEFDIKITE